MNARTFYSVYVANLTVNNTHALIHSTVVAAKAVIPSPYSELINASLDSLQAADAAFGDQMNKENKSPLTQKIVDKDFDRDERWYEIKTNVTTNVKGRDMAKKEAATALRIFFDPYWTMSRSALNTETEQINDMLAKYNANPNLVAQATLIGIATMLTELGTVNSEFDVLYQQRTQQEGAKTGPSASSLKSAAVTSYTQFCTVVEQAVNLTPSEALTTLFNNMDELRKKYSVLVSKPNTKSVVAAK
jgi:hypothetical protein